MAGNLLVSVIAGLARSAMVSAEAGWGEGYGPVAVPVFKTELRGVSCADGSTPSLLRQVLPHVRDALLGFLV